MVIREATEADRQRWNECVITSEGGSFLQSWEWGELQKELGVSYWRLVAEEAGKMTGVVLVIKRKLPLGKSWLYAPAYVPTARAMMADMVALARQAGAIFLRVDPRQPQFDLGKEWRRVKREVQPKETLVIDLSKTEERLLAEMHQKTRYNIRLAEKHGVTVRFSQEKKDLEDFLHLAREVSARSPFRYHAPEYYRAMLVALGGMLTIAVAELNNQPLAVHLLISFGDTVTYVHGASSRSMREVMAPNWLQWESVKRAKAAGKRWYDFYGVGRQWPGVTRFKEGFGGERRSYVGAHDYPLSPFWYFLYNQWHK